MSYRIEKLYTKEDGLQFQHHHLLEMHRVFKVVRRLIIHIELQYDEMLCGLMLQNMLRK